MNNYVSCYIQGGLGNQLFQIASVYEYADMYKKTPIFANVDYLPNQFNYERRTYWDTLFSGKLNVIDINEYNKIYFNNLYEQQGFVYNKLPYINDNVKIIGYFQAHRYISEKTRIKMIELIYSNDTYMYNAYNKYNSITYSSTENDVSIRYRALMWLISKNDDPSVRKVSEVELKKYNNQTDTTECHTSFYRVSQSHKFNITTIKGKKIIGRVCCGYDWLGVRSGVV